MSCCELVFVAFICLLIGKFVAIWAISPLLMINEFACARGILSQYGELFFEDTKMYSIVVESLSQIDDDVRLECYVHRR